MDEHDTIKIILDENAIDTEYDLNNVIDELIISLNTYDCMDGISEPTQKKHENTKEIDDMNNINIEVYDNNKLHELRSRADMHRKRLYDIDRYFYMTSKIDKNKLQIANITLRMSTEFKHAKSIAFNIHKIYSTMAKNKDRSRKPILTDATASIGCDTIALALSNSFETINAIEKVESLSNVLKNNLNVYNINYVNVFNSDYQQTYLNYVQDIVYIDAPWYNNYIEYDRYNLFLNNVNVVDILFDLFDKNKIKMGVLKVPPNFNLEYLINKISTQRVIIDKIKNSSRHIFSLIYII